VDAKALLAGAGALWAFYGFALFTLLKELVLKASGQRMPKSAFRWVVAVIVLFFIVNFAAIAAFQTEGLEAAGFPSLSAWLLSAPFLLAHAAMSGCALKAIIAANRAPPEPAAAP
jgi:hypothetical protein